LAFGPEVALFTTYTLPDSWSGLTLSSSSGQYIRIETVGRKSGKLHQVIARFIAFRDRLIIFPMRGERIKQQWVQNLLANPEVRIFMDDKVWRGKASLQRISGLNDPLLPIFTRKYGRDTVGRYYKGQLNYVEVRLDSEEYQNISGDDLIYGDLEAAFDGIAEHYDGHIFGNVMNTWLRDVSVRLMENTFQPPQRIIEIGCGTGTETLELAKRGINVIACDVSSRMLDVLRRKASDAGLAKNITLVHVKPSQNLEDAVRREIGNLSLEGAYSTYGAINTEPNLPKMFLELNSLLKKDSPLVLGVWNKYCMTEMFGYLLRLKPSLAFARLRNPVPVGRSRFCVASNAYSVRSLEAWVRPYFRLSKVYGVVVFLPPSNLVKYLPKGKLLKILESFDYRIGRAFPFNRLGDHFLAVYKKN
jgi:deazaflavin-dependent oxidoreductase (nitroreductase family)